MCPVNDLVRRQISSAPHSESFFTAGEFIYDPDADWDDLRKGMIVNRNDTWLVTFPPKILGKRWLEEPLKSYTGQIARHVLINNSGLGPRRGPPVDTTPWYKIVKVTRNLLRDAKARRIRLDKLLAQLRANSDLDSELIEDALRMDASMGFAKVTKDARGLWYSLSALVAEVFSRRDYLATFSDELMAKSRRIDYLIQHTGTVGSYREELLRGTIRQLLPTRFQASTGFIENSPRQLDIIVWDAARYAPLFREQEVVVVPREAVRGVIEVKTTLDTKSLDEALEILHDIFRVKPSTLPVFKGIFAFHSNYKSDRAIAKRIKHFYNRVQSDGIIDRKHDYFFQGVTVVCVPKLSCVLQNYLIEDGEPKKFPRPWLQGLQSELPGDLQTAAFLAQLLDHIDMEPDPKRTQRRMFQPIFNELNTGLLVDLFGKSWQPTMATSQLGKTLTPAGAQEYVLRVYQFFAGEIQSAEIPLGLETTPNQRDVR